MSLISPFQTELMESVFRSVRPSGYPSEDEIAEMSEQEKVDLYQQHKQIIFQFRQQAEFALNDMQNKLNDISFQLKQNRSNEIIPSSAPENEPIRSPRTRNVNVEYTNCCERISRRLNKTIASKTPDPVKTIRRSLNMSASFNPSAPIIKKTIIKPRKPPFYA